MATIAITHIGLAGHFGPANRLGGALVQRGHRVVAWAPEHRRAAVESTGAEFRVGVPARIDNLRGGLPGFAALLVKRTREHVGSLIQALLTEEADVVIHDCQALWGRVAGDFLGVPRIVSNPLFPGPLPSSHERTRGLFPQGWQEVASQAEADALAIGRDWGIDVGGWWYEAIMSTGPTTLSYTTEAVVGDAPLAAGWHYVGPLMERLPPKPALDPPLIYVAFGTFSNFNPELFRTSIAALAGEPVQIVVSTGRGPVSRADLEPLPSNVVVDEFVDSREVLAQARVHVTHGGASSVHESLLAGVPMVCLPQAVDQPRWADRVAELQVGEIVELSSDAIRSAVRRLLDHDGPRRRADAIGQELAGYGGAARAVDVVERIVPAGLQR